MGASREGTLSVAVTEDGGVADAIGVSVACSDLAGPVSLAGSAVSFADTTTTVSADDSVVLSGRVSVPGDAPDGDYVGSVSVSKDGQVVSLPVTVTVDAAAPSTPVLVQPSRPTSVAAVSGEAEPGSTVVLWAEGLLVGATTTDDAGEFSADLPLLAEGTRLVTAIAEDAAGNAGLPSAPISMVYDLTPPGVSAGSLGPTDARFFSIVASDGASGSGIDVLEYRFDESATRTISGDSTMTIPVRAYGSHVLYVLVSDRSGNSTELVVPFEVSDLQEPSVVANVVGNNTASVRVSLTATDNTGGSGLERLEYRIVSPTTGTTLTVSGEATTTMPYTTPGSYVLAYAASDRVDNEATGSVSFTVVSAGGGSGGGGDGGGGGGGPGTPPTTDTTAPRTSALGFSSSWYRIPVKVTLSSTDASGKGVSTYYRLGVGVPQLYVLPFEVAFEGVNTISYWSVDEAGNEEVAKSASVRIDMTAPSLSVIDSSSEATAVVDATATDALSGVSSVRYRIDAGSWVAGAHASTSVPGTHTIDFEATDAAGNVRTAATTALVHVDTSLALAAPSSAITYGKTARLSVVLTDTAGLPVAGTHVSLEALVGATWVAVRGGESTVAADGCCSIPVRPGNLTRYRAVFSGAGALSASASRAVIVKVAAVMTLPKASVRKRVVTLSGSVLPKHYSTVRIEAYRKVGRTYRLYRSYSVRVSAKGTYATKLTLPKGAWRFRARHSDAGHSTSHSGYRSVNVR